MKKSLPWFKCVPTNFLGALGGLAPDVGYIYVIIIFRIYEEGGRISDTAATLARRSGYTERRTAAAIEALVEVGKIQIFGDQIDCEKTHKALAEQACLRNKAKNFLIRAEKNEPKKSKQKQGSEAAVARKIEDKKTPTVPSEPSEVILTSSESTIPDPKLFVDPSSDSTLQPKVDSPRAKAARVLEILEGCLSQRSARDLVEHRKKFPLTARAAELLVRKFGEFGDPEGAVEMMITRGWRGFESEWALRSLASLNGHGGHVGRRSIGRSNGMEGAMRSFLGEDENGH